MIKTFKSKINFSYFLLFIFVFFAFIFSIQIYLKKTLINNLRNEMKKYIKVINILKKDFGTNSNYNKRLNEYAKILKIRITFVDFTGIVKYDSNVSNLNNLDNHKYRPEILQAGRQNYGSSIRFSDTLDINMFYVAEKFKNIFIRVAKPLKQVNDIISGSVKFVYIIAGIFLLVLFGVNYILATYLSHPVREIVNFTKKFKKGDYHIRLPVYKLDELGLVKLSLNYLAKSVSKNIEMLSMQKMRIETVIRSVSEGIILLDEEGKVFLYNKGFFNILEINNRNLEGNYYFEAITNSRVINFIDETLAVGEKKKDNFTITKSGSFETKTINVSCIPIENKKGCIILFEDITEEFNLSKLKREFVSNASHEFKTPLAIMRGYIETLLDGVSDKNKERDFLEKINHNLTRLDNIINDVITLNKIEDYKDLFAFTKVNVKKVINNCLQLLKPAAKKFDIKVSNKIKDKINVNSSPELLEIILYNLIDNAIKYNRKKGYVNISAKSNDNFLEINIVDSGIGIPEEQKNKIFERFYTINKSRSKNKGGTGLGLSIVKHAILILRADITVEDNPEEKGSIFILKIPMNVKRT